MTNHQHTICLGKAANWLLKVTLLFSLSAFSGYGYCNQEEPTPPAKTELVVADSPVVKRYISYRHGFSNFYYHPPISGFYQFETRNTSLISQPLFKTAFKASLKQFFSFRQFPGFQLQKTIPKGSDEDLPYLFMG